MRHTLFLILLFVKVTAFAQEGFKGERFIEVTGTAEMEIEPNEITLFIRLREFEENRQKVQLEKIDQDFLNAMKSAGIDRKRLELADAGSNLSKLGKRDKEAFREKSYQLKLTGAAELEKFVEKIEPVKVHQVVITRVHHTDYEKIRLDLKAKALQAARSKAEILLKSINSEIGKVLMIREWSDDPIHPYQTANIYLKSEAAFQMPEEEASTSFRKIKLRAQIAAQFEIK